MDADAHPDQTLRNVREAARVGSATNVAAALLCCAAAGCSPKGADFASPSPWWSPTSWLASQPERLPSVTVAEPIDPHWWTVLNDPMLTTLEARLLEKNIDLRVASVRLAQARAQLGIARVALLPGANVNASYTRQQQSRDGVLVLNSSTAANPASENGLGGRSSVPNSRLRNPYDLFQYGFDASWELDLWGRVARSVEAAGAQADSAQETLRDTQVTASAELARAYVRLRGVQAKIRTTRQNLEIARQNLKLTQDRNAGGVTTDFDVATAAAQLATTEAELPSLQQQQSEFMNAVAFLLGDPPQSLAALLSTPRPIPPAPPRVPVGVPSELARRRPDIRAAEANLHAATATTGVATADFYPRVMLSGSGAIQGLQFRNLADWSAQAYSFGPSVSLPIFDNGRLTRTLEFREQQQQEAALQYQRTVLNALHEVDNALTAFKSEQRRRAGLQRAVEQNRRALALARDRYAQGVGDFLQVLTAQRGALGSEQDLADSDTVVSTNLVQLYKVLGGGWE
jgi:NodT family efflux transporter outer membrane factor (OMF) lipoprotein